MLCRAYHDHYNFSSEFLRLRTVVANYINGRHQAENLKEALLKIINNFDLKNKIIGIVADNAKNEQNCLNSLQKLNIEPIRCF